MGRLAVRGLVAVVLLVTWGGATMAAPCVPRVAEKLGVRFVEVCGAEGQAPFWISVAPMGCSAGEHETIDCPSVTPLLAGASPLPLTSRPVAVVDAVTAYRLCGLRFAGHVATRLELERARATLGLTALVVAEQPAPDAAFRFDTLTEWTAEGACDNPSKPGQGCRFARWPRPDARHAAMASIRACDARPVAPKDGTGARVVIDDRCAAPDWHWNAAGGAQDLPCIVQVPDVPGGNAGAADFQLACRAPDARPPRAPAADREDIAAFRCVVPTWALATFESTPATGAGSP